MSRASAPGEHAMAYEQTAQTLTIADSGDPNRLFSTEHLKTDLAGRTARGATFMVAAQGAKFVITMISAVVLARLLTPQDYGLIAMVAVFTNFTQLFRNLGLSAATMQRAEINYRQVSTLFWVNVSLSVLTVIVTAACARPFAPSNAGDGQQGASIGA